jgi:hypothetical protein
MERELVPRKTLAQYIQNPLGILKVCERHHGVISKMIDGSLSSCIVGFHHRCPNVVGGR